MKRFPRIMSIAAASALTLAALTATPASAAVTSISGKESCASGQSYHVIGTAIRGTTTVYINGKKVTSGGYAVNYNSGLRTGTWRVTGTNLGSFSAECKSTGGFGDGAGGNFRLQP